LMRAWGQSGAARNRRQRTAFRRSSVIPQACSSVCPSSTAREPLATSDSFELVTALLGERSAAEEQVLRDVLVDRSPKLERLSWADAGQRVWLPRYRQELEPYRASLASVGVEHFPEAIAHLDAWLPHLRLGLALLSPEAERRRAVNVFGAWLALLLDARGFVVEALPGDPVRMRLGEVIIEPHEQVRALADGRLSAQDWAATFAPR